MTDLEFHRSFITITRRIMDTQYASRSVEGPRNVAVRVERTTAAPPVHSAFATSLSRTAESNDELRQIVGRLRRKADCVFGSAEADPKSEGRGVVGTERLSCTAIEICESVEVERNRLIQELSNEVERVEAI